MLFTTEEIIEYLKKCNDIDTAISGFKDGHVTSSASAAYFKSSNFVKDKKNLKEYEIVIGMAKQREHQHVLHRVSGGKEGRYWMSLAPRWIEEQRDDTEYLIHYWVNYGDNETYGWFTVEQIMFWFANPGLSLHEIGGVKER